METTQQNTVHINPTGQIVINDTYTAKELRLAMVDAFINAMHETCTRENIISAFTKTGLIPIDPQKPLQSGYLLPVAARQMINVRPNWVSNKHLNSFANLAAIFANEFGNIQIFNYEILSTMRFILHTEQYGKVLSKWLPLLVFVGNGIQPVYLL